MQGMQESSGRNIWHPFGGYYYSLSELMKSVVEQALEDSILLDHHYAVC